MTLREVGERLGTSHPHLPIEAVLTYVCEQYTGVDEAYFAREVIEAVARDDYSPASVVEALRLLAEESGVLHIRRRLVVEDGERIELDREAIFDAVRAGAFYHPFSGAVVEDWERKIETWYEAGKLLDRAFSSSDS